MWVVENSDKMIFMFNHRTQFQEWKICNINPHNPKNVSRCYSQFAHEEKEVLKASNGAKTDSKQLDSYSCLFPSKCL